MRAKFITKPPVGGDHRKNIAAKEFVISQQTAEMVFEMNPIFVECWVAFFSNEILWFTEAPSDYYLQHSYYYQKEE